LDIISCKHRSFDLTNITGDLAAYLDRDSSLNNDCSNWEEFPKKEKKKGCENKDLPPQWISYQIDLIWRWRCRYAA